MPRRSQNSRPRPLRNRQTSMVRDRAPARHSPRSTTDNSSPFWKGVVTGVVGNMILTRIPTERTSIIHRHYDEIPENASPPRRVR